MKSIAIVGASGGIGSAMVELLAQRDDVRCIHATCHQSPAGGSLASISGYGGDVRIDWQVLDATCDDQVKQWCGSIGSVDWLINCVGMLHDSDHRPEKTITSFDVDYFNKSISINTLPTLLLGKHALPALKGSDCGVFATISARVGSISDNRLGGWYSYRSSKAALNMALKCLSIEWARTAPRVRVAALHPGTTDTRLSKPFQRQVPEGRLFNPEKTASLLLEQIAQLKDGLSGRFIAYDGQEIAW